MILSMIGGMALACTMREVQPVANAPVAKPIVATLTVAGGNASTARMPSLVDLDAAPVRGRGAGGFRIDGGRTRWGDNAWAEVTPTSDGGFAIEWRIRDHLSRGGRWTVASIARGTCRPRGETSSGAGA